MRLERFRVQNYKKVRDSGSITVRDLTVFVGKNESGKSALFRGLSKLNPSDGEKYDGLKEFPRRRYTDEFVSDDWPVASAKFALDGSDRQSLQQLCPEHADATHVLCTRHYSWRLVVEFTPSPDAAALTRGEFQNVLEQVEHEIQELTGPEGQGSALGGNQAGPAAISRAVTHATSCPSTRGDPLKDRTGTGRHCPRPAG